MARPRLPTTCAAASLGGQTTAFSAVSQECPGRSQEHPVPGCFSPTSNSGPTGESQMRSRHQPHGVPCSGSPTPSFPMPSASQEGTPGAFLLLVTEPPLPPPAFASLPSTRWWLRPLLSQALSRWAALVAFVSCYTLC